MQTLTPEKPSDARQSLPQVSPESLIDAVLEAAAGLPPGAFEQLDRQAQRRPSEASPPQG